MDISAVCAKYPEWLCEILPRLYVLTGLDATNAFVGKGNLALPCCVRIAIAWVYHVVQYPLGICLVRSVSGHNFVLLFVYLNAHLEA